MTKDQQQRLTREINASRALAGAIRGNLRLIEPVGIVDDDSGSIVALDFQTSDSQRVYRAFIVERAP